jgi:voltage-gated potassium channel
MNQRALSPNQARVYDIIFGTQSAAGKAFDLILIGAILASVAVVVADSLPQLHETYGRLFWQIEWLFTLFFTVEYGIRIWCSPNRKAYVTSGFGLIDLLSILPTYAALFIPEAAPLLILRLFRIVRIFRVLRLLAFIKEATVLSEALRRSSRKIFVFFSMMIIITTLFGCLVYVVEGPENGFHTIPESVYWAIVTITTVGYGDVAPVTALGRAIASVGMLIGYAIIAVPTGIITAELTQELRRQRDLRSCEHCNRSGHEPDSVHCRFCGAVLPETAI